MEEREREARNVRRIEEKRRKVNKKVKEGSKRQQNVQK